MLGVVVVMAPIAHTGMKGDTIVIVDSDDQTSDITFPANNSRVVGNKLPQERKDKRTLQKPGSPTQGTKIHPSSSPMCLASQNIRAGIGVPYNSQLSSSWFPTEKSQ